MSTTPDTTLADAYQTVFDGEKALVRKLRDILVDAQASIVAARGDQPANAPSTPATQFVARLLTSLGGTVSMDLPSVLATYGLQADGSPVVPLAIDAPNG